MIAWYIFTILAIAVAFLRKDLIKEMAIAGMLALPMLLLKPLVANDFLEVARSNGGLFLFLLQRIIISFSFGALASGIYEAMLHKKITPIKHPLRKKLLWLLAGPVIFLMVYIFSRNLSLTLFCAIITDIIIVLVVRKDLLWDVIFSGFLMGIMYFFIFIVSYRGFPGSTTNLWFSNNPLGITLFSIPIEELICIFLFGALWGPLYVAIKDLKDD